jgi:hypothetical protein
MATLEPHADRPRTNGGRWRGWVAVTTVGLAVGWAVLALVADGLGGQDDTSVRSGLAHLLGLLIAGGLLGALHWRALDGPTGGAVGAAVASGLGLTVGFLAGSGLGGPPVDLLGGFALLGIVGGIAQWRLLRRPVPGAGRWVLASGLGYAVGGGAGVAAVVLAADAVEQALGGGLAAFAAVLALLGALGGAVGGAVTATVLVGLLRQAGSPVLAHPTAATTPPGQP